MHWSNRKVSHLVLFSLIVNFFYLQPCLAQSTENSNASNKIIPIEAKTYYTTVDPKLELLDGLSVATSDKNPEVPIFSYKGARIATPEYYFTNVGTAETFVLGQARYWAVSIYSGGNHPSNSQLIFSIPAANSAIRYIGSTEGGCGRLNESAPFTSCIIYKKGKPYFQGSDNITFLFFHPRCLADSDFIFDVFYGLSPGGLKVDNSPFADIYLSEIPEWDKKLVAIPKNKDNMSDSFTGSSDTFNPVDRLIVMKGLLYVYAGDPQRSLDSMTRDCKKIYGRSRNVKKIWNEMVKEYNKAYKKKRQSLASAMMDAIVG